VVNHHISRGKVQKVLEHLVEITTNTGDAIHMVEVELFQKDIGNFVEDFRSKTNGGLRDVSLETTEPTPYELEHARKDGIVKPLRREEYLCLTPESALRMVGKIITHSNYTKQSSGNKVNVRRKRIRIRPHKKRAGSGFSFRPEIPHLRAGDGISFVQWDPEYMEFLDVARSYGTVPYEDHPSEDSFDLPRYSQRRNHPSQTIPKIEWDVRKARRIANRRKKSTRQHHRSVIMSHSKEQLKRARAAMDDIVKEHGTIPQFSGQRPLPFYY